MTKRTAVRTTLRAVATGAFATTLIGLAPQTAPAAPVPLPQAIAPDAAQGTPRTEGGTAPVYVLSPDSVRGRNAAPDARKAVGAPRPQPARAQRPVTAGAFTLDCLPVTAATTVAGAAALLALGLSASAALRRRRSG
ncbi:hypothetical protein [Streptomyces tubercidicus]